jgi:hypothetical protein
MQHTPLFLMLDARVHCLRDPRTASTRAHPRNVNGDSVAEARGPSFLSCLMRVSIAFATQEQPAREHTPEMLMGILSRRLEDPLFSCLMRVSIASATQEKPAREHPPEIVMGILSRRLEDTDRPRPHPPLTMDAGPSRNMWPDPH